ncbi:unnamed protein product [Dovyalis caffra]|uniref:Uncharacterized protein n=1 Tax=Dovyalis caffra TaxID=77055 RepID=A0AAV1R7R3_9ROSI|nr:unnamed protein product [Dovyalis caffra]
MKRNILQVSEVSSRLSRAGTLGLGKAVEVLDTLGSSMTSLNPHTFTSSVAAKGNELGILAFEVANTVVKGSNLMQSLSPRSVRHLKEEVLLSEGVQNLISKDMDELLSIVAADKREELKIFSGEVVRFGNRCKDPQWHNLDRYFEKISREQTPRKELREEAESIIEILMILVQCTAELYHELQILDRMEEECQRREDNAAANQKDDSLQEEDSGSNHPRLGPAGLSLHYANVVMQIDNLVARSGSMPPNGKDALYQNLPPGVKSALRSKLQSFHVKDELTITEIKDEMEKILQWLVPMSTNTAKAHHGFGWVGEWASTGSEANRKPSAGAADIMRIETLHHADKKKTEAYILEQLLWLHHLVRKTKSVSGGGSVKSPAKSAIGSLVQNLDQKQKQESPDAPELPDKPVTSDAPSLTNEDQKILQDASEKKGIQENSNSQDVDSVDTKLREDDGLSMINSHSPPRENEDSATVKSIPSVLPMTDISIDKEKELDTIDRVDVLRYKGKHGVAIAKNSHSPPRENEDSATVKSVPSVLPITDIGIDKEKELDAIDRVDVLRYKGKHGLAIAKT